VIVTQSWGKCASAEFAAGLAKQLGMGHKAADGIFTDSANYVDLIPECSNLSIGYQREHSALETLDLNYLEAVIQRLIGVDWSTIQVVRVPGDDYEPEYDWRADFRNLSNDEPTDDRDVFSELERTRVYNSLCKTWKWS